MYNNEQRTVAPEMLFLIKPECKIEKSKKICEAKLSFTDKSTSFHRIHSHD